MHAQLQRLEPEVVERLVELEARAVAYFEELGLAGQVRVRRAEAMLEPLYARLSRIEARTAHNGRGRLGAVSARLLRNSLVDWELILLPNRNAAFERLGVLRSDGAQVLKERYHLRARTLHPDRPHGDEELMAELSEAYRIVRRMTEPSRSSTDTLEP